MGNAGALAHFDLRNKIKFKPDKRQNKSEGSRFNVMSATMANILKYNTLGTHTTNLKNVKPVILYSLWATYGSLFCSHCEGDHALYKTIHIFLIYKGILVRF